MNHKNSTQNTKSDKSWFQECPQNLEKFHMSLIHILKLTHFPLPLTKRDNIQRCQSKRAEVTEWDKWATLRQCDPHTNTT